MTNIVILSKEIRTLNGLYSLNDLHKASGNFNKHRPKYWLANVQTQELVQEITEGGITPTQVKQGGTNQGTWVCKELVYAYAMWISAKFHLQVIRAFDAIQSPQIIEKPVIAKPAAHQMLIDKDKYIELLETTLNAIQSEKPRQRRAFTNEEKEQIESMYGQYSVNDIAKHLGRNPSSIRGHLKVTFGGA